MKRPPDRKRALFSALVLVAAAVAAVLPPLSAQPAIEVKSLLQNGR